MSLTRLVDGKRVFLTIAEEGEVRRDWEAPTSEQLLSAERSQMIVSKFQAKAALLNAGLLEDTQRAIQGADAITQLAWADAQEFRRNSPTIGTLAASLSLTDEQVDDLFRSAAGIEA